MSPAIPPDQLERIRPVLDALLEQLRQHTQILTAEAVLPLRYEPEEEQ